MYFLFYLAVTLKFFRLLLDGLFFSSFSTNILLNNSTSLRLMEMNESILNHLFLPHYLPSSADDDYLIQRNYANEHKLLECMKAYLNSFAATNATSILPIFRTLNECIQRWSILQDPQTISVSKIQSTIEQLPAGSFLPLYFHVQNAAILIEIDENNINQPLLSSWQVLLPATEITSSIVPHLSCFPVTSYRLHDRSQLSSKVHCELLMDFMFNTIEYSKSHKASRDVAEIRDVPISHYVCQWWIQQFQGIEIETKSDICCQFKKKHRDQIRWNNGLLPFRRSGLWMTIKVVFHTILIKRLGHIGTIVYKLLITHFLTHIIHTRPNSTDLLVHCIRKFVRRLNKIEDLQSSIDTKDVNEWIQHTKQEIQLKINQILPKSDWQKAIQMNEEKNQNMSINNFQLDDSEIYKHLCLKLKAYLNNQNSSDTSALFPGVNNYDDFVNINQVDYIPSIKMLTTKFKYTIGIVLTRIEIWVESCLDQWINRLAVSQSEQNRFEVLLHFFEEYQSTALNHYYSEKGPTDPMGYSRFILTALTIIRSMHQKLCNDARFRRLKSHSIDVPNLMNLFEFLILPNQEDMIRVRGLYDYFSQFRSKLHPDLLTSIESGNAFGVDFANQTPAMNESIRQIRVQAERDKQQKRQEVIDAKAKYTRLMNSVSGLSCTCKYEYVY
jgi:hypothetical protein